MANFSASVPIFTPYACYPSTNIFNHKIANLGLSDFLTRWQNSLYNVILRKVDLGLKSHKMRYFFLATMLCMCLFTKAQTVLLKGSVQDSAKLPVPSALVALYKSGVEKSIKNAIADSSGNFVFSVNASASYYVVASAVGFNTVRSGSVLVPGNINEVNMEPLRINRTVTQLAEVKITAAKPLLSLTDDRIVYNVENDPSLSGLSAADAFSRVPFVAVDGLGNVQLKGQSSYRILLNGKPTSMFASNPGDALKAFPANNISSIEVITNPSAKYEGEGLTGLINIVTKKKVMGFNGSTSFTYSTIEKGNINPNHRFSYKNGKLGISSFIYYAENLGFNTTGFNNYASKSSNAVFARRLSNDTLFNEGHQYGAMLELAYDIDSLSSLSLYGNFFGRGGSRQQENMISLINNSGTVIQSSLFNTNDKDSYPGFETGVDYIKSYKKKGKEMSLSFNHQERKAETTLNSSQLNSEGANRFLQNSSTAKNQQTTFQTDFIHPFSPSAKVEFGSNIIARKVQSNFMSASKANESDPFVVEPENTDLLMYNQNVFGVYGVLAYAKGPITLKMGSRLEQTTVDGHFLSSSARVKQNYFSLLPNASFIYQTKTNKRIALAYNRRLARPGLQFLNPFIDNRDPLFIAFGNEKLAPEFADNLDLSFSSFASKISYSIAVNGSFVNDGIQRFLVFNELTGITTQTYGNVGVSSVAGLNGFVSLRPFKGISYSLNFNMNYAIIKNKVNTQQQNKGSYLSITQAINYDINPKAFIFHNFSYTEAPIQLQGQNGNVLYYNLGGGYKLMNNKFVASLGVNNFFDKQLHLKSKFETANFNQYTLLNRPIHAFSITLRYNYGSLKQGTSKKKGVKIDDGKQDVNGN